MPTEMFVWLAETTLVMTVLLALVLLVRRPLARLSNVRWAYLIWAVPAIRLALSMLPDPVASRLTALAPLGARDGFVLDLAAPLADVPEALLIALLGIWLTGAAWAGLRLVIGHAQYRKKLLLQAEQTSPEQRRALNRYCERMQVFPTIECRMSAVVSGPVLVGLVRPVVVLPQDFFQSSPEPELILRHELVHFKRRDHWCNAAMAMVRCIFWFNPLMAWAERQFRDDQEIACDRSVLATESRARRFGYAAALVSTVAPRVPGGNGFAVGFLGPEKTVKRRTRLIVRHKSSLGRDMAGAIMAGLLLIAGATVGIATPAGPIEWVAPLDLPSPLPGGCD